MSRPTLEDLLTCDVHQVRRLCVTSRRRLAACPRTDPAVLDALAFDPEPIVQVAYVGNSRASHAALMSILHNGHYAVCEALTRRRHLSIDLLTVLSFDTYPSIRRKLAARRSLPRAILQHLLTDPDVLVRLRAAEYHRLPATLLAWCARSPVPEWRQVAAIAPHLRPELQVLLARDPCWQVRRYVPLAQRSNQPLEVAMALALAPELAADPAVARSLADQIAAFASTQPTTSIPRAALVNFLRSPAPAIREIGRRLALNARRARAGADAATAAGIAA